MHYMFLIYSREMDLADLSGPEMNEVRLAHRAVQEEARRKGVFQGAAPLQATSTATTVRLQGGKPLVTDGPFAETKEQLAGFYLVDAKDLNEAIQLASKIPPARVGSIEVRPVRQLSVK
jgi:hypothetical protein